MNPYNANHPQQGGCPASHHQHAAGTAADPLSLIHNGGRSSVTTATDTTSICHSLALLPCHLRDIMDYCIASNSNYYFMIYVLMIVGTKGMLDLDEVRTLKVSQCFVPQPGSSSSDTAATGSIGTLLLLQRQRLETDHNNHRHRSKKTRSDILQLWDDVECPEFSPVRLLLVWLQISGIRHGPLFPRGRAQLEEQQQPAPNTEPIRLEELLAELKYLATSVLNIKLHEEEVDNDSSRRNNIMTINRHTLKKTGYLLAYWGTKGSGSRWSFDSQDDGPLGDWIGDAGTLYELQQRLHRHNPKHRVGRFQNFRLDAVAAARVLQELPQQQQPPHAIVALSDWYVHTQLGVPRNVQVTGDTRQISLRELWTPATTPTVVEAAAAHPEQHLQYLREHLSPTDYDAVVQAIHQSTEIAVRRAVENVRRQATAAPQRRAQETSAAAANNGSAASAAAAAAAAVTPPSTSSSATTSSTSTNHAHHKRVKR